MKIFFACIDGGLICIPTLIGLGVLSIICPSAVIWLKKKFNWCRKDKCKCKCHKNHLTSDKK